MTFLDKNFDRKNLEKDLLMIFIIIVLPFLFFIYKIVPETRLWNTDFFTLDSGNYYNNANFFVWFLCVKLMTLILLSVWFITCMYRWRYILLFPMVIEIFKFYCIIYAIKVGESSTLSFQQTLLFSVPFIFLILLISKYVNYYKFSKPMNEKINSEINNHLIALSKFDVNYYKSIRREFIELKNKKRQMDKKEYLIRLIKLRDQMAI